MSDSDQDPGSEEQESPGFEATDGATDSELSGEEIAFDDGDSDVDEASLGQSEIDDLFGISADDEQPETGIYALLNSDRIKHRNLPLLEACFDRLVHALAKSMRNFTAGNVELSLVNTSSVRYGNYIEAIPIPALVSVFKAVEWKEYGLINIDTALIYAIIDVLLGGRRTAMSQMVEARSFTAIEAKLVERLITLVLKEMTTAFKPLAEVEFRHERLESNPSLAEIASPANIAIL
ncbi:MAG: flagellar motor switch protein FliM, partial [Alphaproteobacteria bacterium]|nr:flagellar motor switch protein FliM [Alphaproteobacteria bacterium]